ncbi:hypothetical protein ACIBSV_11005 [Embleya sp. NPDC050154]|uniref:hypothetical protein n=1 Tax=unclassified Embleya TaxID=2699296 RepID=UPI00378C1F74
MTRTRIQAALKRAGRRRGGDWPHQPPPLVQDALGKQVLALLIQPDAACISTEQLAVDGVPQRRQPRSPSAKEP